MRININEKEFELNESLTIQGLIDTLELDIRSAAVALNRAIIPKGRFSEVILKENDRIDLVTIVPGG